MKQNHYKIVIPGRAVQYVDYSYINMHKLSLRDEQMIARKESGDPSLCIIQDCCSTHDIPMEINAAHKFESKFTSDNYRHDQCCRHFPVDDPSVENRNASALTQREKATVNIEVSIPKARSKRTAGICQNKSIRSNTLSPTAHTHQQRMTFERCLQVLLMIWFRLVSIGRYSSCNNPMASFVKFLRSGQKLNGKEFYDAVPNFKIYELSNISGYESITIVTPPTWPKEYYGIPSGCFYVTPDSLQSARDKFANSHRGLSVENALKNPYARVLVYGFSNRFHHFCEYGFGFILMSRNYMVCDSLYESEYYSRMSNMLSQLPCASRYLAYKPWISFNEYKNSQKYLSDGIIYDREAGHMIGVIEIFGMDSSNYLKTKREKEQFCRYKLLAWDVLHEPCEIAIDRLRNFLDEGKGEFNG